MEQVSEGRVAVTLDCFVCEKTSTLHMRPYGFSDVPWSGSAGWRLMPDAGPPQVLKDKLALINRTFLELE